MRKSAGHILIDRVQKLYTLCAASTPRHQSIRILHAPHKAYRHGDVLLNITQINARVAPAAQENTMGLSTHVLDTMNGCPAAGMSVALYSTDGDQTTLIKSLVLNHDGRTDAPLFDNNSIKTGTYRLTFDVAAYFKARGVELPEPNFLGKVSLDFGVAHVDQHYHVPLLVSPWSYSTYRGS